ncbi:MAG TPA: hypothetical protein DDY37_00770 [Legionella sp.]|nr:hypothetical protein [Legionella sp.]
MKAVQIVVLCTSTMLCSHSFAANINKVDWHMHQYDASHTGFVPVKLDPNKFTFDWKKDLGAENSNGMNNSISPAVTSGNLVFVSHNYPSTLQAFSITDGQDVWKINYGSPTVNPPSTSDKRVFIQAVNNSLGGTLFYGYNTKDAEIAFQTPFNAQWGSYLAPTVYKSNVYTNGGYYGGMYSFDIQNGDVNWMTSLAQYDLWTPAVNEQIAVGYTGGKLNVVDRVSGKWLYDIIDPHYSWTGYSTGSSPVLLNEHTAIMVQSGYLTLFDLDKQEVIKSFGPGYTGQPSTDGTFIFAAKNNGLVVIDSNQTKEAWVWYKQNERVNGQFVITNNQVFLTTDLKTYLLDKKTHKEVWNYPSTGNLSLAKGHLFISSHKGSLEAIKLS